VPDSWSIEHPSQDLGPHLFTRAKFLEPVIHWLELDEVNGGAISSIPVNDEMFEKLDCMTRTGDYAIEVVE
jgi:hypothetical protein